MGVSCINTSLKEFKDKAREFGLSESALKTCYVEFQNSGYAQDYFASHSDYPEITDEFIKDYFFGGNSLKGEKYLMHWGKRFSDNLGVFRPQSKEEARKIMKDLKKVIPANGIHAYKDADGNQVIRASHPQVTNEREAAVLLEALGIMDKDGNVTVSQEKYKNALDNLNISHDIETKLQGERINRLLGNTLNDIQNGKQQFNNLSEEENDAAGRDRLLAAAEVVSRTSDSTAGEESQDERNERQEKQVEEWAKKAGVWHENALNYGKSRGVELKGGQEARVFFDPNTNSIVKVKNTLEYHDLQEFLDGVVLHNTLFPETAYKIIGFGNDGEGFVAILEQPFIRGEEPTQEQIDAFISERFPDAEKYEEGLGNGRYKTDRTLIHDITPKNAIVTPAGNIAVIDAIVRPNTASEGKGGKRSEAMPVATQESDGLQLAIDQQGDFSSINIYAGTNENADLSNFAIRPFTIAGTTYQSVEQAFQAAKLAFSDADNKVLSEYQEKIMNTTNGKELRKIGHSIPLLIQGKWNRASSELMKKLLKMSFEQNPQALQRLISTGNATLTHRQDTTKWRTEFPKLLMEVRDELRGESNVIAQQLIDHLKGMGIAVHSSEEMEQYLKEHGYGSVQEAIEENSEMQAIKEQAIKDGTFMKAPNGKPTHLNERQWLQVRTKNFKKWFGDWESDPENASKVVDENGEPLVVYHTDNYRSNVFSAKHNFGNNLHYFSSDKATSQSYLRKQDAIRNKEDAKEKLSKIIDYLKSDLKDEVLQEITAENVVGLLNDIIASKQRDVNEPRVLGKIDLKTGKIIKAAEPVEKYQGIDIRSAKNYLESAIELIEFINSGATTDSFYTKAVFLNVRTPSIVDAKGKDWHQLAMSYGVHGNYSPESAMTKDSDGLIVKNYFDFKYEKSRSAISTTYAVRKSNQIKSATNNNGQFSTEDDDIQMAIERRRKIFNSDLSKGEIETIQKHIESLSNNTDTSAGLYLMDNGYIYKFNTSLVQYADNRKDGHDGFEITGKYNISGLSKEQLKEIENGLKETKAGIDSWLARNGYEKRGSNDSYVITKNGKAVEQNDGLDSNSSSDKSERGQDNRDSGTDKEKGEIETFTTPQGEIYGFVDKNGEIYLDERVITPEHPVHEYTHLWDRYVAARNPELWKRGVGLMKQTSLWKEIADSENYGKKWMAMGIAGSKLESLIASEVHARLVGAEGARLLDALAKEKGQEGIVAKLKAWILDFWKNLKATFGSWSKEDIDRLTLEDFNRMTVRDFADGVDLKNAPNATYTEQQQKKVSLIKSSNGMTLNEEQSRAVVNVSNWLEEIESPYNFATVVGKAGTGKTTIAYEIISRYLARHPSAKITFGAVSKKATGVIQGKTKGLKKKHQGARLHYASVASILDSKSEITETGERVFSGVDAINSDNPAYGSNIIVFDEASMLTEEHIAKIRRLQADAKSKGKVLKVIFLGDSGQVSPIRDARWMATHAKEVQENHISKDSLSPVFSMDDASQDKLVTRVRQGEGSTVLDYADNFWNILDGTFENAIEEAATVKSSITDSSAFIHASHESMDDFIDKFIELFKQAHREHNPNIAKIVSYTNATVAKNNARIWRALHPDKEKIQLYAGDTIMMYDNQTVAKVGNVPIELVNSEEYTIDHVELDENGEPKSYSMEELMELLGEGNDLGKLGWSEDDYAHYETLSDAKKRVMASNLGMAYLPKIRFQKVFIKVSNGKSGEVMASKFMPVPDESLGKESARSLSKLHVQSMWRIYHAIRRNKNIDSSEVKYRQNQIVKYINQLLDADLGYAMTVHKAQGSTYDAVLVDAEDIYKAGGEAVSGLEKARLLYTAATRASNVTVVLDSHVNADDPLAHANHNIKAINDNIKENRQKPKKEEASQGTLQFGNGGQPSAKAAKSSNQSGKSQINPNSAAQVIESKTRLEKAVEEYSNALIGYRKAHSGTVVAGGTLVGITENGKTRSVVSAVQLTDLPKTQPSQASGIKHGEVTAEMVAAAMENIVNDATAKSVMLPNGFPLILPNGFPVMFKYREGNKLIDAAVVIHGIIIDEEGNYKLICVTDMNSLENKEHALLSREKCNIAKAAFEMAFPQFALKCKGVIHSLVSDINGEVTFWVNDAFEPASPIVCYWDAHGIRQLKPIEMHSWETESLPQAEKGKVDTSRISDKTEDFGVEVAGNSSNMWNVIKNGWQKSNPNGIIAYRRNGGSENSFTSQAVEEGWIGNPFSINEHGPATVQNFYDWIVTGINSDPQKYPYATEELRKAVVSKILSTPEKSPVLYYTELGRPSHATVIGYLVNNKHLLQAQYQENQADSDAIDMEFTRISQAAAANFQGKVLTDEELELYNQRKELNGSKIMSAVELKQLSRLAAYKVSDIITELIEHPRSALIYFEDDKALQNLDYGNMSRIDVIKAVGLQKLTDYVKNTFFNAKAMCDYAVLKQGKDFFEMVDRIRLIHDNWQAFLELANSTLRTIEHITIVNSRNEVTEIEDDQYRPEESEDEANADFEESEERMAEAWQTHFRQTSAYSSLSSMVRLALGNLEILDKNGNPVKNEFGLAEHVNESTVTGQVLLWTQGCTTIMQMHDVLATKVKQFPYLQPLVDKLSENSTDETFKAQFFSNFRKYFQNYTVLYKETETDPVTGDKILTGRLNVRFINQGNKARQELERLQSMWQMKKQQPMKLYNEDGTINVLTARLLAAAEQRLSELLGRHDIGSITDKQVTEGMIKAASAVASSLDVDTSIDAIAENLKTVDDVHIFRDKLFYLNRAIADSLKAHSASSNIFTQNKREMKTLLGYLVNKSEATVESTSFENGKMHYSYVLPSYMNTIVDKLKGKVDNYDKFLEDEYGRYQWFYKNGKWRNYILDMLAKDYSFTGSGARSVLQHTTVLSTDGVGYTDKSPLLYLKTMLAMYFYADQYRKGYSKSSGIAFYNMPMMSNKPSEEYIRFSKRPIENLFYKNSIARDLYEVYKQEIDRIATVLDREAKGEPKIKNFDKNGKKFCFLDYMNQYKEAYEEWSKEHPDEDPTDKTLQIGQIIKADIDTARGILPAGYKGSRQMVTDTIIREMDKKYAAALEDYKAWGLLDRNAQGKLVNMSGLNMGQDENTMMENLENFFWNNAFMEIQLLQIGVTDIAFYKDAEDLQKRLAQLHAPGVKGNIYATDAEFIKDSENPKRITDGKERTVYLKDFDDAVSDAYETVKQIFEENYQDMLKTDPKKAEHYRKTHDAVLEQFKNINVADAQGYSSPTSYRKKAIIFGKWDKQREAAYQNIINAKDGKIDARDLDVLMQPLKPFVYTQIGKPSNGSMGELKVPVQNKNSEYLLLAMDAIVRGGKRQSKLSAIYDIMEESAFDTVDGKKVYNGRGIDTIQFESTVKSGLEGAVDINGCKDADEVKAVLRNAIYNGGIQAAGYSMTSVHELNFEDYTIQNEVPAHLEGEQQFGSQLRILGIADMPEAVNGVEQTIVVSGKNMTVHEAKQLYMKAIVDNIHDSFNRLMRELKLDDPNCTQGQRNKAISDLLINQMKNDGKYTMDNIWAVCVNEKGQFNVPLSDPIHAIKIQQLLNSIIKSRINKQQMQGGPVVQASCYGVSEGLDIVFQDKDGNTVMTMRDYFEQRQKTDERLKDLTFTEFMQLAKTDSPLYKEISSDYHKEHGSNAHAIKYIECYAPATVFKDYIEPDENGNYDIDMIPDELLDMIGYRIPTESKYSMCPLRIKGILPAEAGEAIMLPKDITLLSGSDFDIDKMYIIRPAMEAVYNKKAAFKYYWQDMLGHSSSEKYTDEQYEEEIKAPAFKEWWKINRDEWKSERKAKGDTRDGRNNAIFDILYGILTSHQAADQILSPGNFDEPKRWGYIAAAMAEDPAADYTKLKEMSIDELKSMAVKGKNLVYNNIHLKFFQQNMVAGKLIGIFAQNNTSHAFISLVDGVTMYIPKGFGKTTITTDYGVIGKGMEVPFDNEYALDGINRVSAALASLVAASVDAVKDPVLNYMNINQTTAGIAATLLRMGYDMETCMLLMTQPVVREITNKHAAAQESSDKFVELSDTIDKELAAYRKETGLKDPEALDMRKSSLLELMKNRSAQGDMMLLALLKNLSIMSTATSDIITQTKFNSVSASVGPSIADTYILERKLADAKDNAFLMTKSMQEALDNPVIKAFQLSSLNLAQNVMGWHFIEASPNFRKLLGRAEFRYYKASDVRDLLRFYSMYLMNSGEHPVFYEKGKNEAPLSKERYGYILDNVPKKILAAKGKPELKDNMMIASLTVKPKDENHPYMWLTIEQRGMDTDIKELHSAAWKDLMEKDRELAMELLEYCYKTTGFSFSPTGFSNLIPTALRTEIPGYTENLADLSKAVDVETMYMQFIRNHPEKAPVWNALQKAKNVKDKASAPNGSQPFFQQNGKMIITSGISYRNGNNPPLIFAFEGKLYRLFNVEGNVWTFARTGRLGNGVMEEINPLDPLAESSVAVWEAETEGTYQDRYSNGNETDYVGAVMLAVMQMFKDNPGRGGKPFRYLQVISNNLRQDEKLMMELQKLFGDNRQLLEGLPLNEVRKTVTLASKYLNGVSLEQFFKDVQATLDNLNICK